MGKVTRWFRGVLGMKKDKVNIDNSNAKTKKRWIFGKCMKDLSQRVTVENDSTRMRSCMSASEKEQNKHAIAVAATTAAVASAQAAVAVVRLTSDGRDTLFSGREKWAATKIQSVYRGHLSERTECYEFLRAVLRYHCPPASNRRASRTFSAWQRLLWPIQRWCFKRCFPSLICFSVCKKVLYAFKVEDSSLGKHLLIVIDRLARKVSSWWNVDYVDGNSYEECLDWLGSLKHFGLSLKLMLEGVLCGRGLGLHMESS
ncbi:IQ-DOMAIN 14-like protein [Tanacetum coccineum]